MSDEEADTADPTSPVTKTSRRDRLKGAISRTKTKFKRKEIPDGDADYKPVHDPDVEDFLAKGRNSSSTGRPSISESFVSGRPSTSDSQSQNQGQKHYGQVEERPPDPFAQPQQSPRRIQVPKINVSTSQRWPGAREVGRDEQRGNNLLRPEYQARSQSTSSLAKGRGRARGLSVQFTNTPPVVIGEGGDEAVAATIEISKMKARARSVSPIPTPRGTEPEMRPWSGRSPARRKPVPEPSLPFNPQFPIAEPMVGLRRVQTGMSHTPDAGKVAFDKEFEMSLGLNSASSSSTTSPFTPHNLHQPQPQSHIVAPQPIRPPAPLPNVNAIPALHGLKSTHGTINLRSKFERGHGRQQSQEQQPSSDDPPPLQQQSQSANGPWQPSRYYEQQPQPQTESQYQYPAPQLPRSDQHVRYAKHTHAQNDADATPKPAQGNWL